MRENPGKSYLEYLRDSYGPDRAEKMLTRPDISYGELRKLRKLVPGPNDFVHRDTLDSIKAEKQANARKSSH